MKSPLKNFIPFTYSLYIFCAVDLIKSTASIDAKTNALIQESVKTKFSECTCLTIAHRINAVMDSDRVFVMDSGHVAEFDTVDNLLKTKGIFSGLVSEWRKSASSQD